MKLHAWILAGLLPMISARAASSAYASAILYEQTPTATQSGNTQLTGFHNAAWAGGNGSDYDTFTWDAFTLSSAHNITEVHWRGGYTLGTYWGRVTDFTIAIYPNSSYSYLNEPAVTVMDYAGQGALASYTVGGNAGETEITAPGAYYPIADYSFVLPTPFHAEANTRYWIQITATQTIGDWGLAPATGGDGSCFVFNRGAARYSVYSGDTAFTLYTTDAVPETATLSLVGLGGLLLLRRQKA